MANRRAFLALLATVGVGAVVRAQGETAAPSILIVTDARPAMEALAAGLRLAENLTIEIVAQDGLPAQLGTYRALIVALNGGISGDASTAIQDYTTAGGTLVAMSRSIAPEQPAEWLEFLGVSVTSAGDAGDRFLALSNVPVDLVALTHRSPIIETRIAYDRAVTYASPSRPVEMRLPGLAMPPTLVLVNQTHTRLKRPLLGFKATDPESGTPYMQDTAAWVEELERGTIFYFMIGSRAADFAVKPYVQMIANAVMQ